MKERNSLISTSVLYTIWEHEKKTFSDVLAQFVLYCLSKLSTGLIDVDELCNSLAKEFGLDLPCPVCERVLKRIVKHNRTYVKKSNRQFYLLTTQIDVSALVDERKRTQANIDSTLLELARYLENNSLHYSPGLDVEEAWTCFLEKYGYYYFKDTTTALAYTEKYDSLNYAIGNFILHAYERKGSLWDSILQLLNGLMLAKVLVYEVDNDDIQKRRFTDVTFYLDTPILLNILGFLSPYEQKSSSQMVELLQSMGASFACFEEHFQEVYDILTAYIWGRRNPRRNRRTLAGLDAKDLTTQQLTVLRDSLDNKLENVGIKIVPRPLYNYARSQQNNSRKYIDETALGERIVQIIPSYHSIENALMNDIGAIAAIALLREGRIAHRLERCYAVFVTSNTKLVRCVTEHLTNNPFRGEEIPLILDDVYLTTHAWLKSAKKKTDQALLQIIANANAAIRPSEGFRVAAINRIDSMVANGDFSKDEAIIAQTDWMLLESYSALVESDPNLLTDKAIKDAFSRFKKTIIDTEISKISEERVNAEAERVRDEERHAEVREIVTRIRRQAQGDAKNVAKISTWISRIIGICIALIVVICIALGVAEWNAVSVVVLGFAIIEAIDFFISKKSVTRKMIQKTASAVERASYNKRLHIASKYNGAIANIVSERDGN